MGESACLNPRITWAIRVDVMMAEGRSGLSTIVSVDHAEAKITIRAIPFGGAVGNRLFTENIVFVL